jgi:hypothetical protein
MASRNVYINAKPSQAPGRVLRCLQMISGMIHIRREENLIKSKEDYELLMVRVTLVLLTRRQKCGLSPEIIEQS